MDINFIKKNSLKINKKYDYKTRISDKVQMNQVHQMQIHFIHRILMKLLFLHISVIFWFFQVGKDLTLPRDSLMMNRNSVLVKSS